MAAKRPDFDQIKKLINQLEKLESVHRRSTPWLSSLSGN